MTKISEVVEETREVTGYLKRLFTWIANNEKLCKVLYSIVMITPSLILYLVINYLYDASNRHDRQNESNIINMTLENEISFTIEYLDICIDSKSEELKSLYCKIAKKSYIDNIDVAKPYLNEDIIRLNGYEAMKVNIMNAARLNEIKNAKNKTEPYWFKKLLFSINREYDILIIVIIHIFLTLSPFAIFYYFTNKFKDKK